MIHQILTIQTRPYSLIEFTAELSRVVKQSQIQNGLSTLFIQHTSASLLIQENADPSARSDLEKWFQRLVREDDSLFTHTYEGPDDMPSHIKSALTNTSLSIPIIDGKLALGRWQGVYVWEHRAKSTKRNVVVSVQGV